MKSIACIGLALCIAISKGPSNIPGDRFDNIFLTGKGLRLIDVGISALKAQAGDRLFQRFVDEEKKEIELFSEYFLNR